VLYQNYPNPFNPQTTISFDLPKEMNIKLTIYNNLGEQVMVVANGIHSAGNHQYKFDAVNRNLASGIYFYKLESGKTRIVKKLLVLK